MRPNITADERERRIAAFEWLGYGPQEAALHVDFGEVAATVATATETNADDVSSADSDQRSRNIKPKTALRSQASSLPASERGNAAKENN
jgi:hypothetical protein